MNEDKIREAIIRRLSNYIAQNDSDITEADLVAIANNKAYDEPYTEILLPSPHPEAREEDKETTAEIRQLVGKLDDGHWPSMVLEQIEGEIKSIVARALSRLAAPKPEGQDRTGETVVFDNNAIPYGQDMQFYTGVPAHIRFAVTRINDERYKLTAPGYGGEPYGNGAIYVKASDLPAAPDPRPAEERREQVRWELNNDIIARSEEPAPAATSEEGEIVTDTDGTVHTVIPSDRALAEKLHEMWEDYTDDVEENALRIAIYREEVLRSQLARKDEVMREALQEIIDLGNDDRAYMIASKALAIREPDGRKGE